VVVTSFFHPPLNLLPSREGIVFLTFMLLRPAFCRKVLHEIKLFFLTFDQVISIICGK
jgi:hypothetical protein